MSITNQFPLHVAVVLDGNRRWAKKNNLPAIEGYRRSYDKIVNVSHHLWKRGVKMVTIWGFSTENWKRTPDEISHLMNLFLTMDTHLSDFIKNKVRVTHLGRKDRLPISVAEKIAKVERDTAMFDKFYLNIAIDYGGHDELVRACNEHISKFPGQIFNEESLAQCLDTSPLPYPNPDLIIRTGGERRLSGFMSWQVAYSELAFIGDYLPDLTEMKVDEILEDYSARQRRFGK